MSDKRKQQARLNGLKGGRKVKWEESIPDNDPRRNTHRWLVKDGNKLRLCKSKPSCPHVDLWRGPRPQCADMEAHFFAWWKRSAKNGSAHSAFKAGWIARDKCGKPKK